MVRPSETVSTKYYQGFTNGQCEFLPCHKDVKREFNCLFCYCPLVFLNCPGPYKTFVDKNGLTRKDCSGCTLPHDGYERSWKFIQVWLGKPVPWGGQPSRQDGSAETEAT
jgi:Zn-finger protein